MSINAKTIAILVSALTVAACGHQARPKTDLMDRGRDLFLLLRYDTNGDHQISREEMDAGLKADYAAADTDHDGKLEPAEVQAENQRRWQQEGPQSSPIRDWNMDGNVDFAEYSNAVHSLFGLVDKDKDNVVTVAELQAPRVTGPATRAPLDPNTDSQPSPTPTPTGGGYPGGY